MNPKMIRKPPVLAAMDHEMDRLRKGKNGKVGKPLTEVFDVEGGNIMPRMDRGARAIHPTRLWIGVTSGGVELKLIVGESTNPNHVLGTLNITKTGISYRKSNAKNKPDREIPWEALEQVQGIWGK